MISPSRRLLLTWIGTLAPALGVAVAWRETDSASPFEAPAAAQQQAALGLGAWLERKGITPAALDRLGGSAGQPTNDIRKSFDQDPLITVDGFMLPLGFCRYCLLAHQKGTPV